MKIRYFAVATVALASLGIGSLFVPAENVAAAADAEAAPVPAPVEDDMHEFMEYVFQPPYKRPKAAMAAEPADKAAWKVIKSDGLILAEGGNLLLFRGPEDAKADWAELSVAVRDLGGQLYRAAKQKDYAAATESYKAMLHKCNACHNAYAGGEHQLTP